jgi:hypothetical protein
LSDVIVQVECKPMALICSPFLPHLIVFHGLLSSPPLRSRSIDV